MSHQHEIERKYLIAADKRDALLSQLEQHTQGVPYRQGYLALTTQAVVRVRTAGDIGILTIKGKAIDALGMVRPEFEYDIPLAEAEQLLHVCQANLIEKTRHKLEHQGHLWEIDVFAGDNAGLILAEIELASIEESFARPDWLGKEVTLDHRYKNACLAQQPYEKTWEQ